MAMNTLHISAWKEKFEREKNLLMYQSEWEFKYKLYNVGSNYK